MSPGSFPVVSWALTGGRLAPGQQALRPARLVIYGSGDVIADATYRSDLPLKDITQIITDLTENLREPDVAKRREGSSVAAHDVTTVLSVRSTTTTYTIQAAALDELRKKNAYPASLYEARDRVGELHQHVVSKGQPYTSERVRVIVEFAPSANSQPQPWPETITLPPKDGNTTIGITNLGGHHARDAVRLLPRDLDLNGAWQSYHTATGAIVRASWRYLLPDE